MIVITEGTSIVRKGLDGALLNRIDTGRGVRADLESLENLCDILPGSGRCGLIDGAVTVLDSSLHTFREEYESQLLTR